VKGDVHDIGKNIVGVVLGCNGYEIIDLGVMVSADRILDEAQKQSVDIIGLSGLITPSLDEMVHVASEMKRRNMKQPLLIGGATTSRMHTALRIATQYDNGVIHVLDASRSVSVAGSLLNQNKAEFLATTEAAYEKLKIEFANKKTSKQYLSYEASIQNKFKISWDKTDFTTPRFTGKRIANTISIEKIVPYIDWTPFFIAWEMHGKFPAILTDDKIGKEATSLHQDGIEMLQRIVNENWLTAHAVYGFWPANSNDRDTVTLLDIENKEEVKLQFLRQQMKKAAGQPNISLADFIAPGATQKQDYIGAFAVTIKGIEEHIKRFESEFDDYSKILLQSLADRLAEALTEYLHREVRMNDWGYRCNWARKLQHFK
jgi:5-methyltetrahydrofolate--homocysteine methyltransferase